MVRANLPAKVQTVIIKSAGKHFLNIKKAPAKARGA